MKIEDDLVGPAKVVWHRSIERTAPQKTTTAPACGSSFRSGKTSGASVSETSQTEIAMGYWNRIESLPPLTPGVIKEILK